MFGGSDLALFAEFAGAVDWNTERSAGLKLGARWQEDDVVFTSNGGEAKSVGYLIATGAKAVVEAAGNKMVALGLLFDESRGTPLKYAIKIHLTNDRCLTLPLNTKRSFGVRINDEFVAQGERITAIEVTAVQCPVTVTACEAVYLHTSPPALHPLQPVSTSKES